MFCPSTQICLSAVVSLTALLATPCHGAGAEPKSVPTADTNQHQLKAVRLQQAHYFLGSLELTACQTAMRLDSTGRLKFSLVSSAPDWLVTVFRNDDKKYKTLSLKEFDATGLMPQFVQSFRARFVPSSGRPYKFKYYGFEARRVINRYQSQEYLTLPEVASPEVERIVFAAYRLPTGGGLPLHYVSTAANHDFIGDIDIRGQKEVDLTTENVKTVWVASDFFAAPKNYSRAKVMQEVVVGTENRDQSNDFQALMENGNKQKQGAGPNK